MKPLAEMLGAFSFKSIKELNPRVPIV